MRKRGPRYEKRRKSASALVTRLPKPIVQKQTTRWRHWKSREREKPNYVRFYSIRDMCMIENNHSSQNYTIFVRKSLKKLNKIFSLPGLPVTKRHQQSQFPVCFSFPTTSQIRQTSIVPSSFDFMPNLSNCQVTFNIYNKLA